MAKTAPRKAVASNTMAMRKRAARNAAAGFTSQTIAFSPRSISVVEQVKKKLGLSSREAALNAILERIDDDMFLRQEFLAVST